MAVKKQGQIENEKIVVAHYLLHRTSHISDSMVGPDHFHHGKHGLWWAAALAASGAWQPGDLGMGPDEVALYYAARSDKKRVLECERRMVRDWQVSYAGRELGVLAERIRSGDLNTPDQTLAEIESVLDQARSGGVLSWYRDDEVTMETMQEWFDGMRDQGRSHLITTGIETLDKQYGGFRRGKMYLVCAVTSHHKTTFARQAVHSATKLGHDGLFWTMEDDRHDMNARTLAASIRQADTRTFTTYQKPQGITADDFQRLIHGVEGHMADPAAKRMFYMDEAMPRLSRVTAALSAAAARGIDVVALDFMQLIQNDDPRERLNEAVHWFQVSNTLAAAAKRLDIALIVTVQPTQEATNRHERHQERLTLGDMRGGSAIAQSAYGVILLNKVWEEDSKPPKRDKRFIDLVVAKWKGNVTQGYRLKVYPAKDTIEG
jgi:replicative DNA helicase